MLPTSLSKEMSHTVAMHISAEQLVGGYIFLQIACRLWAIIARQ